MRSKEYIHTIDPTIVSMLKELGSKNETKDINNSLDELKKELASYEIQYADLRNCLNPSANVYSFFFDADYVEKKYPFYGKYLNELVYQGLDKKSRCVFLVGDIIDNYKFFEIFEKNYAYPGILEKHRIYTVCLINIKEGTFVDLKEKLTNESSFLFGLDISKPSYEKHLITCDLVQRCIKFGNKILYSIPEENDKSNYSGLNDGVEGREYCPIIEYNNITFLTNNVIQLYAPFDELKYAVKTQYNIEINEYPKIVVSEEKYKYVCEHICFLHSIDELKQSIEEAVKSNQAYHLTKTESTSCSVKMNLGIMIEDHRYEAGVKWDLSDNKMELVTVI